MQLRMPSSDDYHVSEVENWQELGQHAKAGRVARLLQVAGKSMLTEEAGIHSWLIPL